MAKMSKKKLIEEINEQETVLKNRLLDLENQKRTLLNPLSNVIDEIMYKIEYGEGMDLVEMSKTFNLNIDTKISIEFELAPDSFLCDNASLIESYLKKNKNIVLSNLEQLIRNKNKSRIFGELQNRPRMTVHSSKHADPIWRLVTDLLDDAELYDLEYDEPRIIELFSDEIEEYNKTVLDSIFNIIRDHWPNDIV